MLLYVCLDHMELLHSYPLNISLDYITTSLIEVTLINFGARFEFSVNFAVKLIQSGSTVSGSS